MKTNWLLVLTLFLSLLSSTGFSQTCTYGNCELGFGTEIYDDNSSISGFFGYEGNVTGYGVKRETNGTEYHGFLSKNNKNSWGLTKTPGSSAFTLSFHSKDSIPSIEIDINGASFKVYHIKEERRILTNVQPGCLIGECSKADTTKWYVYQKDDGALFAYGNENNEASGKGMLFKGNEMFFMDGTDPVGQLFRDGMFYFGSFNEELKPHGYGILLSDGKVKFNGNFYNGSYQEAIWSENLPIPLWNDPYNILKPDDDDKLFFDLEIEFKLDPRFDRLSTFDNNLKEILKTMSVSLAGLKAEQLESGSFNSKIQVWSEGSTRIRSAGLSTRIRSDEYIEIQTPKIHSYSEAVVTAMDENGIRDFISYSIPNWHLEVTDSEVVFYECENKNEGRQIIIHKPDISMLKYDNLTSVKIWVVQNSNNYCDETLVGSENSTSVSISRPLTELELEIAEVASQSLTSSQHIETIQQLHSIFTGSEDIKSRIAGNCDENGTCTSTMNLSDLGFSRAQVLVGNQNEIKWESPIVNSRNIRRLDDAAVAEVVVNNYAERLEEMIPELSGFIKSSSVGFDDNKAEPTISYVSSDSSYRINLIADYISNGRLKLYTIKLSLEKTD